MLELILPALLASGAYLYKVRLEVKKSKKKILFYLLEFYHYVLLVNTQEFPKATLNQFKKIFPFSDEDIKCIEPHLSELINKLIALQFSRVVQMKPKYEAEI